MKRLLLALTPMGAAAFVAGGGTFSSWAELASWSAGGVLPKARPTPLVSAQHASLWRTKKALLAMMLIGAAAYFGISGTFANFQAETSNNGSSISSGTLTMSNTVNSGSACFSYTAASADNVNNGCDAAFTVTNTAPGTFTASQLAKITLSNNGSIDGSTLYLYASQITGKLQTQLTSGNSVSTITLTSSSPKGMEGPVSLGDSIVVSYGGHTQTFTASANATPAANSNGAATSISVTPVNATFTFPAGSTVTDTSGNTTVNNTNCYDSQTTVGGTGGASFGTQLNFNPLAGNPFCGAVLMYVQEVTGGLTYCWFGKGSQWSTGSGNTEDANGRCVAPISDTISGAGITGTITSIPLASALNGNVNAGDTIRVTQGAVTQDFTAAVAPSETFGATSIAVTSQAVSGSFTGNAVGATVTDPTQQTSLDSNAISDSVSNFDTGHHLSAGRLELFPITSNGNVNSTVSHPAELAHAATRTFYVGLYLPKPSGSNQNALQGLASTFGLTWHMDQ